MNSIISIFNTTLRETTFKTSIFETFLGFFLRRHQQIQAMLQNQPVFIEYKKLNIFYLQTNNYADANRQE